ncbi:hypothetical protein LIER_37882 [Lithospermum erythrorhizon]|uniref:Uncharacterized protein n=1 Tax=Lithospermum erythrorhizon TaxID=34254 RepID=A0AAV3PTL8_LITER
MHTTSYTGWLTSFGGAKGCKIFVKAKPGKVEEGRWQRQWCYLRNGMDEVVPKVWIPLAKVYRLKPDSTPRVEAQIATLQGIFHNQYDYKVFCEEGVLIHVGMICSKEFDPFVEPSVTWVLPFHPSFPGLFH